MEDTVTVSLVQGAIKGKKVITKAGITYYSFQGIPYAKPPVDSLRFKPPIPPVIWDGVRDALTEGSVSSHIDNILGKGFIGSEDSLFINVYTTKLPCGPPQQHSFKPVMVWVHGGGFIMGSGNTDMYGPDYLMAGDVVLISFNYRLGPLGFLSTGDSEVTGNMGLKDQVMALRWVHLNITHFGGDSGNVTIFGESAGGASVHHLMLSPLSKGLFHRVISQSGVAISPWAYCDPATARKKAFKLGETLGCKTESSKELVEFLRNVPVKDMLDGVEELLGEEGKHPLPLYFSPTKEKDNKEIFLPDSPLNIITEGKFYDVPLIMGYVAEEGLFALKDAAQSPEWYESLNDNFHIFISRILNIEDETKAVKIANKIKNFYFGDKLISKDTYKQYADFYSDVWFLSGIYTVAQKQVTISESPIYMYRFNYEGRIGFSSLFHLQKSLPGASHGDDLGCLFHMAHHDKLNLNSEDEETKAINKMVKLWTNFAKTGNPTPENDPDLGVTWKPISKTNLSYLNIEKELSIKKEINQKPLAFWEEIFAAL